jgi:hypothetical protein
MIGRDEKCRLLIVIISILVIFYFLPLKITFGRLPDQLRTDKL